MRWFPPPTNLAALFAAVLAAAACRPEPAARVVEVTETVRVRVPPRTASLRLWVPKPAGAPAQRAELLEVSSPVRHRVTKDPDFGNELLFVETEAPKDGTLDLKVRYRVSRDPQGASGRDEPPRPWELAPRGLVVIDPEIRRIAEDRTRGLTDPLARGRALYDYVLGRMRYDKSGAGWGRGDSVYACRVGKGNCTDFHALFMALAISSGLPARFRMGFSLPEARSGTVAGYHCWAEFYARGTGWVPVDISEAWKNPARKDFYFGRLDESRILVSTGREIRLSPAQKGAPLNFLSRPYAEADGRPLADVEFSREYRDLAGG